MSYDDMLEALKDHPLKVTSKGTISTDVKAIFEEWRQLRVSNVDDVRMTELARLLFVIEEAEAEWEKSKNRKRTKVKYSADKIDKTGKPREGILPDEIEVVTFYPERQYLETIVKASESLRKLMGADAAEKVEQSGKFRIENRREFEFVVEASKKLKPGIRREIFSLLAAAESAAESNGEKD